MSPHSTDRPSGGDPDSTGNPLDPRRRPGADTTGGGRSSGEGASAVDGRSTDDRPSHESGSAPGQGPTGSDSDGPPAQDATDPQHRRVPPAHPGPQSTDPDPGDTPGLDAGGGVAVGDTPPIESGTSGLSAPEAKGPSRAANLAIPVGIILVLALLGVALILGRVFGG